MRPFIIASPAGAHYIRNILNTKLSKFEVTKSLFVTAIDRKLPNLRRVALFDVASPVQSRLKEKVDGFGRGNYVYFYVKSGWEISLVYMHPFNFLSYSILALGITFKQNFLFWNRIKLVLDHLTWSILFIRLAP